MRFVWLLVFLVAGVARAESIALSGATMGTTYHIKMAEAPAGVSSQTLQAGVDEILADIDRQMSTWRPDSEVSLFNRAPAGEWFPVSAATATVVAAAQEISRKSDGALDVTVGPLVRLWHFGPDAKVNGASKTQKQPFTPPSDEAIESAEKTVGFRKLQVRAKPPALRKEGAGLEIDLSSIASGYAIDRLAALLAGHGIDNFLVEIGGEIRAAGRRADGKPWRVAIERPIANRREPHSVLPLNGAAIATAGNYKKFFEHAGHRYSHVIDPRTCRPIDNALGSVTVVADTCIAADGWDTPLLVLGLEQGFECAVRNNIAALFLSNGDEGESSRATPAWQARFGADAP